MNWGITVLPPRFIFFFNVHFVLQGIILPTLINRKIKTQGGPCPQEHGSPILRACFCFSLEAGLHHTERGPQKQSLRRSKGHSSPGVLLLSWPLFQSLSRQWASALSLPAAGSWSTAPGRPARPDRSGFTWSAAGQGIRRPWGGYCFKEVTLCFPAQEELSPSLGRPAVPRQNFWGSACRPLLGETMV